MRVHRAGGAEDNHRCSIAPRVEDRHARMHEPDVGVQRHRHRFLRYLAVTVGDGNRMLFVQADDHLRIFIAQIVDDTVVESPVARAGHESNIFEVEPAGHFRDHIAAPLHLRLSKVLWPVDLSLGLASFGLRRFLGSFCFHWSPPFSCYYTHSSSMRRTPVSICRSLVSLPP